MVNFFFIIGADFTAAKGIAALIDDFNKRKQMIYFFRPRDDVIAVFKGAALEDFQYVTTHSELDYILYCKYESLIFDFHKFYGLSFII